MLFIHNNPEHHVLFIHNNKAVKNLALLGFAIATQQTNNNNNNKAVKNLALLGFAIATQQTKNNRVRLRANSV